MRKPAGREEVRQACGQVCVGRCIRVFVNSRFVQRLGTDKGGLIGVLAVQEWHETGLGQFRLAPVTNGHLGRALHVYTTVVSREGVCRKSFNRTAGFDATNAATPTVFLEGAVDVERHTVSRVHPCKFRGIPITGVFLERKFLDRVRLCTINLATQEFRHREANVFAVFAVAQATPTRIFRCLEDLGQVTRVGQFAPAFKLHERSVSRREERRVARSTDLSHFAQKFDIGRRMVKVIVTDKATIRFATDLVVFFAIKLFEDWRLIPGRAFEFAQGFVQFFL